MDYYKILWVIVTYTDFPWYIGLSNRIESLVNAVVDKNIDKIVIAHRVYGPAIDRLKRVNISTKILYITTLKFIHYRFKRLYKGFFFKALMSIIYLIALMLLLIRIVRRESSRYSCIVIQYEHIITALPIILSSMFSKKSIVIGDDINLLHIRYRGLLKALLRVYEYFVLKKTDIILTASKLTIEILRKNGFSNIIYIPNMLPYKLRYDRESCMEKINRVINRYRKAGVLETVFTGNFTFTQNIRAFRRFIKAIKVLRCNWVKVNVIGGPVENIMSIIDSDLIRSGVVEVHGFLSEENKRKVYDRSLIALLPFFSEERRWGGQMTKTIEFMSECFIVIGGSEALSGIEGVSGRDFIVVDNVYSMLSLSKDIVDNIDAYRSIPVNALSTVRDHYSIDSIRDRVEYIIKGLCLLKNRCSSNG